MLYLYFLNSANQQGQPSWTFCLLGQWFCPNCNADRPYNSEYKFDSVCPGILLKREKASLSVEVCRSKCLCFISVGRLFPADNTETLKNKGNYEFLTKDDFDTSTN